MLKKMRGRVIIAAMLAFLAVISLIGFLINYISYRVITGRADYTLARILEFENNPDASQFPIPPAEASLSTPLTIPPGEASLDTPVTVPPAEASLDAPLTAPPTEASLDTPVTESDADTPERPFLVLPDLEANYMTRFFSVHYDEEQNLISTGTDYIASVSAKEADEYGRKVLARSGNRGYIGDYRYLRETVDGATVIIFLNTFNEQNMTRLLRILTITVSCISLLLVFILVFLFSGKAIRPLIRNIERQKQFITDASHELKTPLTSISTSVEVIEMELGPDEWLDNIRSQTGRMSRLVGELVTLSRLDEGLPLPFREHFSLSQAAHEIVDVYRLQAKGSEKNLTVNIRDGLSFYGEKASIQQLLSVLLDNAIRYSDPHGEIRFNVSRHHGKIHIEVFNTCHYDTPPDVKRLFDRFYRPDSSRSTATGGNGIGLAIAQAVTEMHGGTITASCPSGNSMTIKVIL